MTRYSFDPFAYVTPPELSGTAGTDAPVIIIGAGPIGLAAAVDLPPGAWPASFSMTTMSFRWEAAQSAGQNALWKSLTGLALPTGCWPRG